MLKAANNEYSVFTPPYYLKGYGTLGVFPTYQR